MAVTHVVLSGSTDGVPIKVVATATAGTLIHTAHATSLDVLNLSAANTTTVDVTLTVEFGGVTAPDNLIKTTIHAGTTRTILVGGALTNSKICRVFASTANVVNVFGYVQRIS